MHKEKKEREEKRGENLIKLRRIIHTHTVVSLHIVDIAWVGHLLCVYSKWLADSGLNPNDSTIQHVLQVHKPPSHIPQVIKGVVTGWRVPGPNTHMKT